MDSLADTAEFCYKCNDFLAQTMKMGDDSEIDIRWLKLKGEYRGTASAEGYYVDGVSLHLSDKDQKWLGIKESFKL